MPRTDDMSLPDHLRILLYGPSGSGKTFFTGTAPKPMYVFDCDDGIKTLKGVPDIEYDVYKPNPDPKDMTPLNKLIAKANKLLQDCPYETVTLDSLTKLTELVKNRIITISGRWSVGPESKDSKMRIQDWQELGYELVEILTKFQHIDANVIITSHNKIKINDDTKSVLYLVASGSGQSFPQALPADFDEIYKMEVTKSAGSTPNKYRIMTESDNQWIAKSRLNTYQGGELVRVFNKYEEPNFSKLLDKLKKARERAN